MAGRCLPAEWHFLEKADQSTDKKRIVEIESVDLQINMLAGLEEASQEKLLAEAVEQKSPATESFKRIKDLWLSGDAEKLGSAMSDGLLTSEAINKALLQGRNPHMADVAEQFLTRGEPGFIVVGPRIWWAKRV